MARSALPPIEEPRRAALETDDTGKTPGRFARKDMADIAGVVRYYAGMADKDAGEVIAAPDPRMRSIVVREPVWVCGQISPWNHPLLQASWKLAPALAAGNTTVVEPSELTPLTTIQIFELLHEQQLPAGVADLVLGAGPTVGAELASNHDVDLVSFTGGIAMGREVMTAASGNVKKVALELGGKNPDIVFADADREFALDHALVEVFLHAGRSARPVPACRSTRPSTTRSSSSSRHAHRASGRETVVTRARRADR